MAQVFISHASADFVVAERVAGWLRAAGHRTFLDHDLENGLGVGDVWTKRLFEELYEADALVAVVTAAFGESPWCAAEVGIALANGLRLLPVRAGPDAAHRLISSEIQWTDLDRDGETARAALLESLRRLDGVDGRTWSADATVYPGLAAFTTGQSRVFFGRATESRQLAERVRARSGPEADGMLMVIGPSGCGKSSLVRAGLTPMLAADPQWLVLPPLVPAARQTASPLSALGQLLAAEGRRRGLGWRTATVVDALDDPSEIIRLLTSLLDAAEANRLLLIVDQAEELLVQTSEEHQIHFASVLREAARGPARVVATVRSEFLDPLVTLAARTRLPIDTFAVKPLSPQALPLVITGPARHAGIGVDDELVARMVADTGTGDALPLLAFVLAELGENVSRGGALSGARYDRLGGVRGALAHQADQALEAAARRGARSGDAVLASLLRLVAVDEYGQATRRRVPVADLPDRVRADLRFFVDRRLLTIHESDADPPATGSANGRAGTAADAGASRQVVDIAHEQILSAWPPLADAIGAAIDRLRLGSRVLEAARQWAEDGRPASHLWEPERARRARQVLDADDLPELSRTFLTASRRSSLGRRWRTLAVLGTLLLLVTASGLTATVQRADALARERHATAHGLVLAGEQEREQDVYRALRLAIAGVALHSTPETRKSLESTLAATPWSRSLDLDSVVAMAVSPGLDLVATGGRGGHDGKGVCLWRTPGPGSPLRFACLDDREASALAFSADGRRLAAVGRREDGWLAIWDISDPQRPRRTVTQPDPEQEPTAVVFGPDGQTLAVTSRPVSGYDGTLTLWDATGKGGKRGTTRIGEEPTGVAVSPLGGVIAVTSRHANGGALTLWNITGRGAPTLTSRIPDDQELTALAFSPDGHSLATTSRLGGDNDDGGRLQFWRLTDRHVPTRAFADVDDQNLGSVAFSPDGRTVATASFRAHSDVGRLRLWNADDIDQPVRVASVDEDQTLTAVRFSFDGRTLVTSTTRQGDPDGRGRGRVRQWDIFDLTSPAHIADVLDDRNLTAVAFSPDGRLLATTCLNGRIRLWEFTALRVAGPIVTMAGGQGLTAARFAPDGHTLVTASFGGARGGSATVWDVASPQAPRRLTDIYDDQNITSIAISPDGHTLATTSSRPDGHGGRLRLWDLAKPQGHPLASRDDAQSLTSAAFSPDGRTLAISSAGGDGRAALLNVTDLRDPTPLGTIFLRKGLAAVAFSPDGRTLATASTGDADQDGGSVGLWEVSKPRFPSYITGFRTSSARSSVAFGVGGRTLAVTNAPTTKDSGSYTLWNTTDINSPSPVGSGASALAVAFSPDGRTLATAGSKPAGARISLRDVRWDRRPGGDPVARACDAAGGGFTRTEWREAVPGFGYRNPCR
ncbi:TIR domain-containing protein [Frankia sp. QA3]|uniref:nSTAND1 domain-containing NTPase n=1 Tax=Frankia sp. QA3 TaxID=710111 RepID=UPI00030160D0|nr:TIR domain-containing protein [Frankia sp. QA3]